MSEKYLSERVQKMEESATIAMSQKCRELVAIGKDVINLSIGEPDFNTPDAIKAAAKKAIDENFSKYTPVAGTLALKKAIVDKFKRENNLHYTPDQICVSTGAKQVIANVILALVNEGDEVIIPAPYWVSYSSQIKFAGGVPVEVKSGIENDFKITPEQLSNAITDKTKLIIYSSPCNPSGSVYSSKELKDLAQVIANNKGVFVLADEIYEYINFTSEKTSIASFELIKDQTITVNGVAKGFAMTGWRIGYMGAPEWLVKACTKIQGQFTSGANSIAQQATIEALNQGEPITTTMKNSFLRRRNLVVNELKKIPGIIINQPQGAFYAFPDVSSFLGKKYKNYSITTTDELCLFILNEGLVACVGGGSFGAPECIRLSYASSDELLVEALKRIKKCLALLN